MRTAARVLARRAGEEISAAGETALHRLGRATGLVRFLRAVPELEARNRIPLVDGRPEAIAARAGEALGSCPTAKVLRGVLPVSARAAATEAWLTRHHLRRIAGDPSTVARGVSEPAPLTRSFLLWRWSRGL
jgi:phytoene synthase